MPRYPKLGGDRRVRLRGRRPAALDRSGTELRTTGTPSRRSRPAHGLHQSARRGPNLALAARELPWHRRTPSRPRSTPRAWSSGAALVASPSGASVVLTQRATFKERITLSAGAARVVLDMLALARPIGAAPKAGGTAERANVWLQRLVACRSRRLRHRQDGTARR